MKNISDVQHIYLDTNIVIDFLGERAPFYDAAAKVISLADKKKVTLFTSANTICTAYYLLSKYESTRNALEKIRRFKVLCSISVIDDDVIQKAIQSDFKNFEDAVQYYSALATGCQVIITRNERDFKNALVPVMNAESYLQVIKK